MIAAALILVVGAAAAAYFLVFAGDDADDGGTEVAAEEPATDSDEPTTSSTTTTTTSDEPATTTPDSSSGPFAKQVADGYPAESESAMEADIEDVIRRHHLALVAGRYRDAWELLSSRKRIQYENEGDGYEEWQENQEGLAADIDPSGLKVRLVDLEGDGVARIEVGNMPYSGSGAYCAEWDGLTWAKYEAGEWTYDPGASTTSAREREWGEKQAPDKYPALLGADCY
jgi:hypothetical protein